MFRRIRRIALFLHRWIALAASVLVILIAGSGAILVFEHELDRALNPALSNVTPQDRLAPLAAAQANITRAYPRLRIMTLFLPPGPAFSGFVLMSDGTRVHFDPYTGGILGSRHTTSVLMNQVHQFHTRLLVPVRIERPAPNLPPRPTRLGNEIVGWSTVVLLFLTLSGLLLWFPRMTLGVARGVRWRRFNLDLHNVTGIYAALFAVILAATGIVLGFEAPARMIRSLDPPAAPVRPPVVKPEKGRAVISPDEALAAALAALPGAAPGFLVFPGPQQPIYGVSMHYPEDASPFGRSNVAVNAYTGEVVARISSRGAPVGTRILNDTRPWHTGDIYGWPSRILAFLASVAIVAQAVTGLIAWWARTFRKGAA